MLHDRAQRDLPDGWGWDQGKLARSAMFDMEDDGKLRCYVYEGKLVYDQSGPAPRTGMMPLEVVEAVLDAEGHGAAAERRRILARAEDLYASMSGPTGAPALLRLIEELQETP